jgi:hypothetical protein
MNLLECSASDPSDPDHHLRMRPSGYWQLRLTVDRGPKYIGQRVVIGLRTRDPQEARARRDLILDAMKQALLTAGPKT